MNIHKETLRNLEITQKYHKFLEAIDKEPLASLWKSLGIYTDNNDYIIQGSAKQLKKLREFWPELFPLIQDYLRPGTKIMLKKKSQKLSKNNAALP